GSKVPMRCQSNAGTLAKSRRQLEQPLSGRWAKRGSDSLLRVPVTGASSLWTTPPGYSDPCYLRLTIGARRDARAFLGKSCSRPPGIAPGVGCNVVACATGAPGAYPARIQRHRE